MMSPFDKNPADNKSELDLCIDEISQLQRQITALQEKYRWIQVSEKLPVHDKQVWICYEKNGYTYNAYYDTTCKMWHIFDYSGNYRKVEDLPTHWREIDLPKETGNG